jgi:hypothetical protein
MPTPTLRTTLLFALLVLPLAALPGRSGAAPPSLVFPNITGFWSGEFSSVSGLGGLASLEVTEQDRRRFEGTFVFYPPTPIVPPNPCFVRGTVSRSGEISMVGRNDAVFLRARGSVFRGAMQLDYSLNLADGSFDAGTVAVSIETGGGT